MHKLAVENRLQPDDIRKLLYGETENRNTDFEIENKEEQKERQKILDDFYKEEEEEEPPIKKIFVVGIFLVIGVVIFWQDIYPIWEYVIWGLQQFFL